MGKVVLVGSFVVCGVLLGIMTLVAQSDWQTLTVGGIGGFLVAMPFARWFLFGG